MIGPPVRTDIVEVYVFRLDARIDPLANQASVANQALHLTFLQMHRARGVMATTWQPVMGHIEPVQEGHRGESAIGTAIRELAQETGYTTQAGLIGFWQLESVSPYFMAKDNCVMMSPCFAAQVADDIEPVLNEEHDGYRWVRRDHVDRMFVWPGQRIAIDQIVRDLVPLDGLTTQSKNSVAGVLRINLS